MLTGRNAVDPGFRGDRQPRPTDWPSIASIVGDALPSRSHNLPPAIVLPERLVHWSGGVIPGAYGGQMGPHRDPFFIEASPYGNPFWRGAYPEFTFPNLSKKPPLSPDDRVFQAPILTLSPGVSLGRLNARTEMLRDAGSSARRPGAFGDVAAFRPASPVGHLAPRLPGSAARLRRDECRRRRPRNATAATASAGRC